MPTPPCGPKTSTQPRATRRPPCRRKARTPRSLETPTCGTEAAPGGGGKIWGPDPGEGLPGSPCSPLPLPLAGSGQVRASAGRPSPSASVRLGVPGPLTHSSVSVESRSQLRLRVRVTWLHVKVTCGGHAPAKSCSSWGGGQSAPTFSGVFREIPATLRDVSGASVPGLAPL